MSTDAHSASDRAVAPPPSRLNPWLVLGCWALIAAAFAARAIFNTTTPLILDTDDAMRLTMVHDFLAGQGWYDLVQHRLNTPWGGSIHWSRLIDLPEATLIGALRPFAGAFADTLAAYLWPLGLLLLLVCLTAKLSLRLAGPEAVLPGLLLPAFSLTTMAEFAPGRFDHHSAQILLTLAMLYCAVAALDRPRFAIAAGLAASMSLAIGIEGLPMVAVTALVFGLAWVAAPARAATMRDFGLSFGLGAALQLVIALPPSRWFAPLCDAISIVYVAAAMLCGIAFVLLSLLRTARWPLRFAAGIGVGLLVAGVTALAFPGCLKGPYGSLDPWLITHWIDRIGEAKPWLTSFASGPTYPLAIAVPPLLAALAIGWRLWRGGSADRSAWLVYAAFLLGAAAVTLLEIRGSRMLTPLAMPGCAWLIVAARHAYLRRRSVRTILALVGSWLGAAGIAVAVLVNIGLLALPDYAAETADPGLKNRQACLLPAAFAELAALPPARIMAPIDLGSHLLLFTQHAVVAAPYHRNQEAVLDAFAFFSHPIVEARAILQRRGVSLVVICPAMPEVRGLPDRAPDSFAALYAAHQLPAWLQPVPLSGTPLQVFAVAP